MPRIFSLIMYPAMMLFLFRLSLICQPGHLLTFTLLSLYTKKAAIAIFLLLPNHRPIDRIGSRIIKMEVNV
jgi:hypothetical protein